MTVLDLSDILSQVSLSTSEEVVVPSELVRKSILALSVKKAAGILKGKQLDVSSPSNYRGISISSTFSKLFELMSLI